MKIAKTPKKIPIKTGIAIPNNKLLSIILKKRSSNNAIFSDTNLYSYIGKKSSWEEFVEADGESVDEWVVVTLKSVVLDASGVDGVDEVLEWVVGSFVEVDGDVLFNSIIIFWVEFFSGSIFNESSIDLLLATEVGVLDVFAFKSLMVNASTVVTSIVVVSKLAAKEIPYNKKTKDNINWWGCILCVVNLDSDDL